MLKVKVKVQFTVEQTTKVQRGSRGTAVLVFNLCARGGWIVSTTTQSLYLRERPDRPQGRTGWVWKISPPKGFDARTAHPVASLYTD